MKKVVINTKWGSYWLSTEVLKRVDEIKGTAVNEDDKDRYDDLSHCGLHISREDPDLIKALEEIWDPKKHEFPGCSDLAIIEIPDDVDYYIDDNEGVETIREKHRFWN